MLYLICGPQYGVYMLDVLAKHPLTFLVVSPFIGAPQLRSLIEVGQGLKLNCVMK